MSLASPRHASGRAIPPSVFPVVPAQRARLGLRKPVGSEPPPVSAPLAPEPGPFEPSRFEPPVVTGPISVEPAQVGPGPVEPAVVDAGRAGPDRPVEVVDIVAAEEAGGAVAAGGQRSWWRRVRR